MSKNETYDIGVEGEAQAYQSLDRNLIYLSAGAIVVSLVILKTSLTDQKTIIHAYLIIVAGLLLCLTLIFSLWSFFSSAKGFRKIYSEAKEREKTGTKVSDYIEYKVTNILNWCSIISFTVGLLTLLTFVVLNIFSIQEEIMTEQKLKRNARDTGIGAVLPPEDRTVDKTKNKSSTEETIFEKEGEKMTQENESQEIHQDHPEPEPDSKPDIIEEGVLPPEDRTTSPPQPSPPNDEE